MCMYVIKLVVYTKLYKVLIQFKCLTVVIIFEIPYYLPSWKLPCKIFCKIKIYIFCIIFNVHVTYYTVYTFIVYYRHSVYFCNYSAHLSIYDFGSILYYIAATYILSASTRHFEWQRWGNIIGYILMFINLYINIKRCIFKAENLISAETITDDLIVHNVYYNQNIIICDWL